MNIAFAVMASVLIGAGLTVAGVYLLAGAGWAFIAAGVSWLGVAVILRRGAA